MHAKKIKWDDPEFVEAIRLINKFFPESKAYIRQDTGISIYQMLEAMRLTNMQSDTSCEFNLVHESEVCLKNKGGLDGANQKVYTRILEHINFSPKGRAVVIPNTLGKGGWAIDEIRPFVCVAHTLHTRLEEIDSFFHASQDIILVFETGEAICIDHDQRVFWATSQINRNKFS